MFVYMVSLFALVSSALSALTIDSSSIRYEEGSLSLFEGEWIDVESTEQMAEKIASLEDDSMTGMFAALFLLQLADRYVPPAQIIEAAEELRNARTMDANLSICIDRVLEAMKECPCIYGGVVDAAEEIYKEYQGG